MDSDLETVIAEAVDDAVKKAIAPLVAQLNLLQHKVELNDKCIIGGITRTECLEFRMTRQEEKPAPAESPADKNEILDALEKVERSAADTDNELRRGNLVISGMRAAKGEAEPAALGLFNRMGVKLGPGDLTSARHLSAKDDGAILVKFSQQKKAEAVLKAGRGLTDAKIKPDYSIHTRRARGNLFGTLLRLKSSSTGLSTPKLMGSRIVDGQCTYRWHARREAVECIRPGQAPTYSPIEPVPVDTRATATPASLQTPTPSDKGPAAAQTVVATLQQEADVTVSSPKRRREQEGTSSYYRDC